MNVERKFKTARDETCPLMLGAQILFGFEFHAVFQDGFEHLSQTSRTLDCVALLKIGSVDGARTSSDSEFALEFAARPFSEICGRLVGVLEEFEQRPFRLRRRAHRIVRQQELAELTVEERG